MCTAKGQGHVDKVLPRPIEGAVVGPCGGLTESFGEEPLEKSERAVVALDGA